jgi:hypothetical protein
METVPFQNELEAQITDQKFLFFNYKNGFGRTTYDNHKNRKGKGTKK